MVTYERLNHLVVQCFKALRTIAFAVLTPSGAYPALADTSRPVQALPTGPISIWDHVAPGVTPPRHIVVPGGSSNSVQAVMRHGCGAAETVVEFTVKADGTVTDVSLVGPGGNQYIDDAFAKDVSSWKYSPAIMNGTPIAVRDRAAFASKLCLRR